MSGSIELTGAQSYRIEVCEPNIDALMDLFLSETEEILHQWPAEDEALPQSNKVKWLEEWPKIAASLRERTEKLHAQVVRRCRDALMAEPNLQSRQNLMGRILVQHLIETHGADKNFIHRFFSFYMRPFLSAFEEILGPERFAFFNRVLHENLLNNCVIHDLLHSSVDWKGFYHGTTVNLVMRQVQNIRRWMEGQADGRAAIRSKIEMRLDPAALPHFEADLDALLIAWGLTQPAQSDPPAAPNPSELPILT